MTQQVRTNLGFDQQQSGYVNPFANFGPAQGALTVKPPAMGELAEFENDVEESSTDWGEVYRAHAQRKRQIDIMDDRSEGEVGPPVDDDGESIGEILDDAAKVNNILGKKLP